MGTRRGFGRPSLGIVDIGRLEVGVGLLMRPAQLREIAIRRDIQHAERRGDERVLDRFRILLIPTEDDNWRGRARWLREARRL